MVPSTLNTTVILWTIPWNSCPKSNYLSNSLWAQISALIVHSMSDSLTPDAMMAKWAAEASWCTIKNPYNPKSSPIRGPATPSKPKSNPATTECLYPTAGRFTKTLLALNRSTQAKATLLPSLPWKKRNTTSPAPWVHRVLTAVRESSAIPLTWSNYGPDSISPSTTTPSAPQTQTNFTPQSTCRALPQRPPVNGGSTPPKSQRIRCERTSHQRSRCDCASPTPPVAISVRRLPS